MYEGRNSPLKDRTGSATILRQLSGASSLSRPFTHDFDHSLESAAGLQPQYKSGVNRVANLLGAGWQTIVPRIVIACKKERDFFPDIWYVPAID